MRFRFVRLLLPLVAVLVVIAFVFIWRARSREVYGPAVALCPGPDRYGYTCEGAAAYAYIDATTPTGLVADDGVIRLDLPFPFVFYGQTYEEVTAAVNGNLQFTTSNASPFPACLSPAAGMGDLISPYWADLDLTLFGALETEVVGEAPTRIFVIEWDDVPLYGLDTDDRVTFEAQLFEAGNHVVFLYEDPATTAAGNGGRAVVGIQSAAQGLALSFSCLQPVLPTSGGLRFVHPTEPNPDPAAEPDASFSPPDAPATKGVVGELIAAYAGEGMAGLERLRLTGPAARPPRVFDWRAADLSGDGRAELIGVWGGRASDPQVAQVAALAMDGGQLTPLFEQRLSTRDATVSAVAIEAVADLTGDDRADVVLHDRPSGRAWVLADTGDGVALYDTPGLCRGGLIVVDEGDSPALVRDGCPTPGRNTIRWDGMRFGVTGD
jgi:hypothetical protein